MLGRNIRFLRLSHELSQDALAAYCGRKSYSTIQKWETEESSPNLREATKLSVLFGVSIDDMVNEDLELRYSRKSESQSMFSYPVIEEGVAAGYFTDAETVMELPMISVPDVLLGKYARNKDIVFMHVCGESMNNLMEAGTVIAVLRCERERVSNGDVVIASMGGREYTVKYFYDFPESQQIILKPDSRDPSFIPIVISYECAEEFQIFGKVVIYQVEL